MDTGVENPSMTGSVDESLTDAVIIAAFRLIADVYGDRSRPLVDIRPVATGYRVFVEDDEGLATVWVDHIRTETGPLYVADTEGPYQVRHIVVSADPEVAIARAVFAARPGVTVLKRHHAWIAPQTPVYIAWALKSPQLLGVGTTLSAAMRYAGTRTDADTARYVCMPFSNFVTEIAGGYGYELISAVEWVIRYGAAALRVDREVAARLEKAAA